MKNKFITPLIQVIFIMLFGLLFSSCDFLNSLLNEQKENEIEISKSGLAVNKYLSGTINESQAEITLYAGSSTFHAETGSKSYSGKFVYNSSTKQVFLYSESEKKYYKASVDLSGSKGSVATTPAAASFGSSTKAEFTTAVQTVADLPVETTEDLTGNPDNQNPGDDKPNTQNQDPVVPANKTLSTYEDGIRYINFGEKDDLFDTIFVSTIQPQPRPDFSAIDNAVKNLVIDSKKMTIEEAAEYIVQTAKAKTIKEKARAIFTWIAWHVDYDHTYMKNTEETAYYDRLSCCDGFSTLMQKMCEAVNIECDKYAGLVAGLFEPDKFRNVTHAWNLIHINKQENIFFLVDVTWAANSREAESSEWDVWFDPDPCYFATSHFSDEYGTQVSPRISRNDFMALPILDPSYEFYGIDGKELLEFCYKHSISDAVYLQPVKKDSYPNIYSFPISHTIYSEKEYAFTCEHDGKTETKKFTTDYLDPAITIDTFYDVSNNGLYLQYILKSKDSGSSSENPVTEFKAPNFIYYDDTVQVRDDYKFKTGDWYVINNFKNNGKIMFFAAESGVSPSAIYDAYYQQWELTVPSYYSKWNYVYKNENIAPFPSELDELKEVLNGIFLSPVNEAVPLQRRNSYFDTDYYDVYIPLSKKEEAENAVLNYDWTKDEDFADFVHWMENHNIPNDKIEFYKEMARYPDQRGSISEDSKKTQRFAGKDYISHSALTYTDEGGVSHTYWAGGMQLYFEYRKRESRHLFRNPTIPLLLVHIKDSKGTGEQVPANFFEEEQTRIKDFFKQAGFTNTIDTYVVEIEIDYDYFTEKYIPTEYQLQNTDWGYDLQWSWKNYDLAWEEIVELAAKKNPELAQIFADKNKSAMIRYFDTKELNSMWGNVNGYALMHGRFDNIMNSIGYSKTWHCDLFGSILKTKAPECFDTDCQREVAVCPLCLYSFDID
jgi:hypothetical protein